MTSESYLSIYRNSNIFNTKYSSISPSGSLGAELIYNLKGVSLGMDAGYLLDLKGELTDKEDGNPLLDPNNTDRILRSDWSGWFVHLKAIIKLNF